MLAVGYEKFGSEEELQKNPIKHLFDIYVQINKVAKPPTGEGIPPPTEEQIRIGNEIGDAARAYFKRMEDGTFFICFL